MKRRDPRHVPMADRVHCVQCAELIDARGIGNGRQATGWLVNRAAGGANMLTQAVPADVFICKLCLDARARGHSWVQPSLFGDT